MPQSDSPAKEQFSAFSGLESLNDPQIIDVCKVIVDEIFGQRRLGVYILKSVVDCVVFPNRPRAYFNICIAVSSFETNNISRLETVILTYGTVVAH